MREHSSNDKDETVESVTPVPAYPAVGSTIADYRITGIIESGGMGIVYRADDPDLNRQVALKVISPALAHDKRFRERFNAESRAIGSLRSPYILPIYRAGEAEGLLYLSTPLIDGGDLRQMIADQRQLTPSEVSTVATQIGKALDFAHAEGMIHRDVKPANILVEEGEGGLHCYLADFGITRNVGQESGITGTGEVLGTVDYMAPEVIEGGEIDGRADVYALGCTVIELLTGKPPFRRETRRETMVAHLGENPVIGDLPPGVDRERLIATIGKAIAKDPTERYPDCASLAKDLELSLTTERSTSMTSVIQTGASPEGAKGDAVKQPRRGLLLSLVTAVILVFAGAAGAWLATGGNSGEDPATAVPTSGTMSPLIEEGSSDPSTSDNADPGPETVENPVDVPFEKVYESGGYEDSNFNDFSHLGTAEDFAMSNDRYPSIGRQEFNRAMVVQLDPVDLEQSLSFGLDPDWTDFKAEVGMEVNEAPDDAVSVTFLASDGTSNRVLKSLPALTAGQSPQLVSLDLSDSDISRLTIRFQIKPVDRWAETDPIVVLGNARFTGMEMK